MERLVQENVTALTGTEEQPVNVELVAFIVNDHALLLFFMVHVTVAVWAETAASGSEEVNVIVPLAVGPALTAGAKAPCHRFISDMGACECNCSGWAALAADATRAARKMFRGNMTFER
jgi:hypothetical protein